MIPTEDHGGARAVCPRCGSFKYRGYVICRFCGWPLPEKKP